MKQKRIIKRYTELNKGEDIKWDYASFTFIVCTLLFIILLSWINPYLFELLKEKSVLEKSLDTFIVLLSASLLLIIKFSFPRIQNLRVYLCGYLFFSVCIGIWFYNQNFFHLKLGNDARLWSDIKLWSDVISKTLIPINILIILVYPSFTKYSSTRAITLSFFSVNIILSILLPWFMPPFNIPIFKYNLTMIMVDLVVFVLIFYRMKNEHGLGGVLAGVLVISSVVLVPKIFPADLLFAKKILYYLIPINIFLGLLYNWIVRLSHRVAYDPLLQIYNREYCNSILEERTNIDFGEDFSVAIIDIDFFKKVNDTYGHSAGDVVLYNIAQIIAREAMPDGITCRYGGEEIVVFFPDRQIEDAKDISENIRKEVEETKIDIEKKNINVTVSIGVSCQKKDKGLSIREVLDNADKALYEAKEELL